MKKLTAIIVFTIFLVIGCQESSTIVAPNNDSKVEKTNNEQPIDKNVETTSDSQEPSLPRI